MFILSLNLVSHICGHVLQGSQDAPHALHVLLHLHLAVVIGDPQLRNEIFSMLGDVVVGAGGHLCM